ncbi:reverse transcriptase [Senna tora]|uniref:Reverse transcriptase n=1 Tax=Senna tora TaxID=362788 RepID=A0A835C903_9FABA|nr:reverse transcriptase [Senna tora]
MEAQRSANDLAAWNGFLHCLGSATRRQAQATHINTLVPRYKPAPGNSFTSDLVNLRQQIQIQIHDQYPTSPSANTAQDSEGTPHLSLIKSHQTPPEAQNTKTPRPAHFTQKTITNIKPKSNCKSPSKTTPLNSPPRPASNPTQAPQSPPKRPRSISSDLPPPDSSFQSLTQSLEPNTPSTSQPLALTSSQPHSTSSPQNKSLTAINDTKIIYAPSSSLNTLTHNIPATTPYQAKQLKETADNINTKEMEQVELASEHKISHAFQLSQSFNSSIMPPPETCNAQELMQDINKCFKMPTPTSINPHPSHSQHASEANPSSPQEKVVLPQLPNSPSPSNGIPSSIITQPTTSPPMAPPPPSPDNTPPAPPPSPVRPNPLLVIPMSWPREQNMSTDHGIPPPDSREFLLNNLYNAYLNDPSSSTRVTVVWINLLRGILNHSPWLPLWVEMMNEAHFHLLIPSEEALDLSERNIFLMPMPYFIAEAEEYNWFPLNPKMPQTPKPPRQIPFLENVILTPSENKITLLGNQDMCVSVAIPQHLVEVAVCVKSYLRLEQGALNYNINLNPTSILMGQSSNMSINNLPPPYDCFCLNDDLSFYLKMNILAWNVKGAGGAEFRRVFRATIAAYQPDAVILTETRLSGERALGVIATLGFEHAYKVDAMGFAGGIWLLWNDNNISIQVLRSSF